jgi:hypothetical protein
MKKALFALALAAAAVVAWSQPKVAVLDAMIPQNMDPSVIVPATEKIIERLVVSGRFTVLDRANIESVLKEREFQVSGMVNDQDVVTAGKYLGADFVVVAKISKVGDTYFISAKMINIKTGVIANQTSAQGEGKISTLIDLSGQVGEVLSGGAVTAQSATGESKDISKPADQPKEKPAEQPKEKPVKQPREPGAPRGKFIFAELQLTGEDWTMSGVDTGTTYTYNETHKYVGLLGKFDTKYFDLGLGLGASTGGTWKDDAFEGIDYTGLGDYVASGDITNKQLFMITSADLKLPLQMGSFAFFPLIGMEYDLNLSYTDKDGNDLKSGMSDTGKSMLNRFYLKAGIGLDFAVSSTMLLRMEAIYGYKVKDKNDKAWDSWAAGAPFYYTNYSNKTGKFDFTASVGFKL